MAKKLLLCAALLCAATSVSASSAGSSEDSDTTRVEALEEITVSAVRAKKNAPFAVTNISRSDLETFSKSTQELPFLFARTPGVLAWGENGVGTGTTYMRIRGAGDSRINVTIDGVPLNSPEDQCVFWANMNSYASLLGSVQIQRGVGTSTNGDGAFGGSVSLSTRAPQLTPGGEITGSYGSYNTWRVGVRASTGLLWKHLVIDGAYNHSGTEGFVHGTKGRSGSYYGGITWLGDKLTIRYRNIGNFENTGQAWNGVIAGDYDGYQPLNATYDELHKMGYGQWNSLYENIYSDNGTLRAERYRMRDGSFWERTTDRFHQNHNILSAAWDINERWRTSAAFHYTYGYGYYDEFKYNSKLSKFGLPNFTAADGSTVKKTDFVRQKGLKQHTFGLILNAEYKSRIADLAMGVSAQRFKGNHFGYLTYMANEEMTRKYLAGGDYKYYDSDATKDDVSAFVKATFHLSRQWDAFADAQYRYVGYSTDGYNDKYNSDLSKNYLNINKHYHFFNPKAGISFHEAAHHAYASVAYSNREPERNNFTDNGSYPAPSPESVIDVEAGYEFSNARWHAGVNLYYMNYRDQFVQTGAVSDIGEALTTNVKSSYRMGMEVTAGVNILPWLSLDGNLALSRNRISDFDEVVEDWDEGTRTIHYDNSTLAYSPTFIGNIFLTARHKGFRATWHTGGVSRMYVDNSASADRSIPGYCVSNLNASYTFTLKKRFCGAKEIEVGANLNNVFNKRYAASGFVWYQYYFEGVRNSQMSYIPSAGITAMGSVTIRF